MSLVSVSQVSLWYLAFLFTQTRLMIPHPARSSWDLWTLILCCLSALTSNKCSCVRLSAFLMNDLERTLTSLTCLTDADGKISVKFGVLFNDDQCANLFEALVGTLKAAKRKKIITFEGELLLQGVHDNVDVILLQDWVWQSFLNLSEKVQMFLTCHCYILIWKYTWM